MVSAMARGDGQSGPIIGRLTVSGDSSDAETRAALRARMMAIAQQGLASLSPTHRRPGAKLPCARRCAAGAWSGCQLLGEHEASPSRVPELDCCSAAKNACVGRTTE